MAALCAAARVQRRGRLVWYGLAALACAALLLPRPASFVPAPGARPLPPAASVAAAEWATAATAAGLLLGEEGAWAKEGKWGPLEGKASSLVHPLIEPTLFFVTLYAGFLGYQWRQTRLIGAEIAELRKQLPKETDAEVVLSTAQQAVKAQIEAMTKDRSELVKGQYKDRHHQVGSILLGSGIFFTVYGVFNTWFRTEKLFPGPHLFAGAAICVLWALAAACVPFMEKGNDLARNVHIAINVVMLALFTWQLPTGFEILEKVWGNANLPWF